MFLSSTLLDARMVGAQLPRHLGALWRASRRWPGEHEILVVDDTGDPQLQVMVERYGIRLLRCNRRRLGERLNLAARESQGEVLLFPGRVSRRAMGKLGVMLGEACRDGWDTVVLPGHGLGVLARWWWRLHRPSESDAICVKRDWFERIGGCDEQCDRQALVELVERLRACRARVVLERGRASGVPLPNRSERYDG